MIGGASTNSGLPVSEANGVHPQSMIGGASSNSGLPISEADRDWMRLVVATEQILIEQKKQTKGWHAILNNATSTRGKNVGGPLFPSLKALTQYVRRNDGWDSTLHMPCSYEPNDGIRVHAMGKGVLFSFRRQTFLGGGGEVALKTSLLRPASQPSIYIYIYIYIYYICAVGNEVPRRKQRKARRAW
jgi:hypothetical protein